MAFAKFEGKRFRIDGEIPENHAILAGVETTGNVLPASRASES